MTMTADMNFINKLLLIAIKRQLIEYLGCIFLLATVLQSRLIDYGQAPFPCIQTVALCPVVRTV